MIYFGFMLIFGHTNAYTYVFKKMVVYANVLPEIFFEELQVLISKYASYEGSSN